MRYIFTLLLFVFVNTQAQIITGVVKDSITMEALPYVNITLLNSDKGASTNTDGEFKLNLSEENKNDTLLVSFLGYKPKIIPVKAINKQFITVTLQKQIAEIEEVQLKVKKAKYTSEKKAGLQRNGDTRVASAYGLEECVLIKNEKKRSGKLTDVYLYFKKNSSRNKKWQSNQAHFLIKFYRYDEEKRIPGELLNVKPILIKPENKKATVKLEVEGLNILFPKQGICVGIETVKPADVVTGKTMASTYPYQVYTHSKEPLSWGSYRGKPWKKKRRLSYFKKNMYSIPLVKLNVKYKK